MATRGAPLSPDCLWVVRGPDKWPGPPSPMSFTVLRDIETCPLRWSLRRGSYTGLWSSRGYPSTPRLGTLAGQVVHGVLERIVGEVARQAESPDTVSDDLERMVRALRALNGITAVLEAMITDVVRSWEGNPRFASQAREWDDELRRQLPTLRLRVQQMLAQVNAPHQGLGARSLAGAEGESEGARPNLPAPLSLGLQAEVSLNNPELDWFGKADLLHVGANTCAIIDFKTGIAKEDHGLQLRIYALLWQRDKQLNPSGRPATALTLVYGGGPVAVAVPGPVELDALASELAMRSSAARAAVTVTPPEARPSRAACEWCDVRHLCGVYWRPAAGSGADGRADDSATRSEQASLSTETPTGGFRGGDLELRILAAQGAWSWHASVSAAGVLTAGITTGERVLVRARPRDPLVPALMIPGTHVRVVDAQILGPTEESADLPVVALGRNTEVFVLPSEVTPRHDGPDRR